MSSWEPYTYGAGIAKQNMKFLVDEDTTAYTYKIPDGKYMWEAVDNRTSFCIQKSKPKPTELEARIEAEEWLRS